MWCKRVRSQLSAYADGELGAAEGRQVEAHLARCADCAQEHASLQRLVRLTTAIPLEEIPSDLHAAIIRRLSVDRPSPRPAARPAFPLRLSVFNPWMWTAVGGAAAALVMGLLQRPCGVEGSSPADRSQPGARAELSHPARPDQRRPAERRTAQHPVRMVPVETEPQHQSIPAPAPETPAEATATASPQAPQQSLRVQVARKPGGERLERPQPADPVIPSKLAQEPKTLEPPAPAPVMTQGQVATVPDEPETDKMVTGVEQPEVMPAVMEKDASTRMAGAPGTGDLPEGDDEGVRSLRMFLEERNRSVPQPPLVHPTRMRKL